MMWLLLTILVIFLAVYAIVIEPNRFRVHQLDLQLPGPNLGPFRVLHLSDLHFYKGKNKRKDFIHKLAQDEYDFIFITGDLIDNNTGINLCLVALRPLKARYGIYAVMGNHDYYHVSGRDLFRPTGPIADHTLKKPNNVDYLIQGLTDLGINVLRNERVTVDVNGTPITIAGLDDPYVGRDDLNKTFAGYDPETKDGPCILLVHSPEKSLEIAHYQPDIVLMGHTHGGQVRLPLIGALITRTKAPRRFADGFTKHHTTLYYTSRGLGTGELTPFRFFCTPETTVFNMNFNSVEKHSNMKN